MSRQQRTHATRRSEGPRAPAWVWLFTGVVLGAFIMFLMRLSEIQTDAPAENTAQSQTSPNKKDSQKPRFDFYELLKDSKVPLPSAKPSTSKQQDQTATIKQEFLLQVASFKSSEDADQLRAKLILLNLEAYTEQARVRNGETWHRVLVGPFTSNSKLAKARSILLTNRYEALVLKRTPKG